MALAGWALASCEDRNPAYDPPATASVDSGPVGGAAAAGGTAATAGGGAAGTVDAGRDGAADAPVIAASDARPADALAAPSGGDTCATPIVLGTIGANESLVLEGTTAGAKNDILPGPCNGEAHPDIVYQVACAATGRLYVALVPVGWAAAFVVHEADACGSNPNTDLCNQGLKDATIKSDVSVEAGRSAWVWIDGGNAESGTQRGPFQLTLRCAP